MSQSYYNPYSVLSEGPAPSKKTKAPEPQKAPAKTQKKAETQAKPAKQAEPAPVQDVLEEGFTSVSSKRTPAVGELKKEVPRSRVHSGTKNPNETNPRKRPFDRHMSGTGRGKEIKREGHGPYNWGSQKEEIEDGLKAKANADARRERRKQRSEKPKSGEKGEKAEKAEKAEEKKSERPPRRNNRGRGRAPRAPRELTPEEIAYQKEQEELRKKEEEEAKRLMTLDQYEKKVKSKRPPKAAYKEVVPKQQRNANEGIDAEEKKKWKETTKKLSKDGEGFIVLKGLESDISKVTKGKKKAKKAAKKVQPVEKEKKEEKKEKKVLLTDFLAEETAPRRNNARRGRKPATSTRAPKAALPKLSDESQFPVLK